MLIEKRVAVLAGTIYFVQGALGIAGIALPLHLRAQGFSIATITFMTSIAATPWFFKIIYGAISDAFPIRNLRRKPYLVMYPALSSLGWLLLSFVPSSPAWLVLAMGVSNFGLAATDVITDGFVVDHSDSQTAQVYQSISWGSRSLGALVSGVTGGWMATRLAPELIFLIAGLLPLIAVGAAFLIQETAHSGPEARNLLQPIVASLRYLFSGDLKWFSLLLMIVSSSASFGTPLFFYMREELKFNELFLGTLQSTLWLGAIIGCVLSARFFNRIPLVMMLYWATAVSFFQILLVLGIREKTSALSIFFFAGILGYVSLLPFMSSAAKLAHGTGVEGSLFAVLMGIFNLASAAAAACGGRLAQGLGLEKLIILTAFLSLSGFLVIPRLKTLT